MDEDKVILNCKELVKIVKCGTAMEMCCADFEIHHLLSGDTENTIIVKKVILRDVLISRFDCG